MPQTRVKSEAVPPPYGGGGVAMPQIRVKSEAVPPPYGGGGVAMPQIRDKPEAVPQTDGPADCAGAAPVGRGLFGGRAPRRGDVVELTLDSGGGAVEGAVVKSCTAAGGIAQLDGCGGGGNKRRKTESGGFKEGDDDDGDDAGGDAVFGGEDDDNDDPGHDEELGSEDDDEDQEPETSNLILCQYDTVKRSKAKWKAQLKCGLMQIDGFEYAFNKASGDMNFQQS
jgi:hypothetical protein